MLSRQGSTRPSGQSRSRSFKTKTAARRFLERNGVDQQVGQWADPRLGKTLVRSWVDEWWSTTTNLRPSTRVRDRDYIDRYVVATFGDWQLGRLSQLDVRRWVASLSNLGLAPATVVKAYQLLAKVMSAAVDAGLIASTPCRRIPLPRIERIEMRFLTPAEIGRLADAIDPRYRALVLVGAYGGLRIGELAGLRHGRVDLLGAKVEVAEILVEVRGELIHGTPKTKAGRRTVSLPRSVADELGDHMARWAGEDHVFTSPRGGPLRVPAWRQREWRTAVTAAGLAPLRPHDMRHTAVALWIAAGGNVKEVARRAGHSSVAFTLDRYGHLYPGADEALSTRLEDLYEAPAAAPMASITPLSK